MRKKVAVLASGEGTTVESVIRASKKIDYDIKLVICNKQNAGIFVRVQKLNHELGLSTDCLYIGRGNYPPKPNENLDISSQTVAEEAAILKVLNEGDFDLICLMGYLKKIGPRLVQQYGSLTNHTSLYQAKMLNSHPGLLPDTKGLWGIHVQEYVLKNNLHNSGQSLIVVAQDYDDGAIVAEHKVAVRLGDTPSSLFERVQAAEKQYLAADIDEFIKNRQTHIMQEQNGI